ncbi:MAG TPA: hypothetical protein VHX38_02155 [Pseudonocardiaceae bacterium]|nr:hypothetical protein [Pseudonocardiaceae bacterium]
MATDLTFNIAALDRASATFVNLAGKVDLIGQRLDSLDHKRANPKVDLDTSNFDRKIATSQKGIDAFSQTGQAKLIALGGALAAGAVSGGALLAIPVAIAAIGIAAEKSNPQVVASFTDLKQSAKETAEEGFLPLVPALVGFASQAKTSLGEIKPELEAGSAAAAPLVSILGTDLLKATQQGVGGSISIIGSLRPVVQAAGDDLVKIEQGTVGLLKNLDTGEAAQGLSILGDDLAALLPEVGQLVSEVVPLGNALLGVAGPAMKSTADAAEELTPALNAVASVVSFLGPDITAFAPPIAAAAVATRLLTGSWTDFGGAASRIKPLFTDFSGTMDSLGQKIGITSAATNKATAEQAAEASVAAELAKAESDVAVAEAEQAFAAEKSEKNAIALVAAQEAQAAAAANAAKAEATLAATSEEASFAFGPLGIALGAAALLTLPFITNSNKASAATQDLTSDLVQLAQAAPGAAAGVLDNNKQLQDLINNAKGSGVNVTAMLKAIQGGAGPLKEFADDTKKAADSLGNTKIGFRSGSDNIFHQSSLAAGQVVETLKQLADETSNGTRDINLLDPALRKQVTNYNNLNSVVGQLNTTQGDLSTQQSAVNAVTTQSNTTQQQAAGIASVLGISIGEATAAYNGLATGQTFAMSATQQSSDAILGQVLAVHTANSTVSDYFKQADQQLAQAKTAVADASQSYRQSITAVADAQHSYTQSVQAVADAQHSEAQAQQAVVTAQQGVVTAQRAVTDAVQSETSAQANVTKAIDAKRQAQLSLTAAEAAATEQLKQLHLQLADQVTSEQSARVSLFDAQTAGAALGVNAGNAQQIANQKVTSSNEDRVKAAIALLQAENSLNDTLNTGTNLRNQVTAADKAGVAGSSQVIQAEQQIASAQQQVVSAEQALLKAHQAVADARAGVVKAEQGVSDALYNEQKAHQAVTDAEYNEGKARDAIKTAEDNEAKALAGVSSAQTALTTARDNASHSMDINTAAGARNFGMLKQIADQLFANEAPQQAQNDLIKDTATLFGISNGKARTLLTSLGLLTKKPFKFNITSVADVDLTKLRAISLPGTGGHITAATGGQIFGPGGPRDDKIPAMLSNREYVQPVSSVDYYGVSFMEAIRQKRLPRKLASGGLVGQNVFFSGLGSKYQAAAEAETLQGKKGWPLLPAYVPPALDFGFVGGVRTSHAANAALMKQIWASMFGWTGSEWNATEYLMMRESGFNNLAQNPTSTAFGQFQFLDSTWAGYGIPKTSDARLQDVAGGRYIGARYHDPLGAAAHERAFNWYRDGGPVRPIAVNPPKTLDGGGYIDPGYTLIHNGTGERERTRTGPQEDALLAELQKLNANIEKLPHFTVNGAPQHSVDQLTSEVMRRLEFHGR